MDLESRTKNALLLIEKYSWLIDSYMLDFYVDEHWEKLPRSWKDVFEDMEPRDLGLFLQNNSTSTVFPLSFLALLKCVQNLSIDRKVNATKSRNGETSACGSHPNLKNLFLKHVKEKKRHEICRMNETVVSALGQSEAKAVVDFGSGLGHLIRTLAYKFGVATVGLEANNDLIVQARKLDAELEYTASKHLSVESIEKLKRPSHLNEEISVETDFIQLGDEIASLVGDDFGLVGLHPCGDLGPLLLRFFVENPRVKFNCTVGCCYMKLTPKKGFPLSNFVNNLNYNHLSYASREIACHAYEIYCQRLRDGLYEELRVHSYRAALERILVKNWPNLRHSGLKSIKHTANLPFQKYCEVATEKLGITILAEDIESPRTQLDLRQWKRVVIFYTCRLILAPLVESVILLDRMLYLRENHVDCKIEAVFDPVISPRNHIITALRK